MKRTLAVALLLFAALWPLVHRVLVARYDLNPWKFGGWAMYTTPTPPLLVALFTKQSAGFAVIDESTLSMVAQQQLKSFREERHALGKLRRPDELARTVLRTRPDLSSVVVIVQRMTLDHDTALVVPTKDIYNYDRAASLR